jgi:hypothetical protein
LYPQYSQQAWSVIKVWLAGQVQGGSSSSSGSAMTGSGVGTARWHNQASSRVSS